MWGNATICFSFKLDSRSRYIKAYLLIQSAYHKDKEIDYAVHSIINNLPFTTLKLFWNFIEPESQQAF